jgi:hypothetical protein
MGTFYRISRQEDGLVDIWLTPGKVRPDYQASGRMEFTVHTLAVRGIDPEDPQWGGDLEGHVREHYESWVEMAEEVEI